MTYQIIIAQERRTGERKTPFTETGQLHCLSEAIGPKFETDDNIVYVAEWDGKAPYVTVLKGDHAARKLDFAGWPAITKDDYVPPAADL